MILSDAEARVRILHWHARGFSPWEIARILQISELRVDAALATPNGIAA